MIMNQLNPDNFKVGALDVDVIYYGAIEVWGSTPDPGHREWTHAGTFHWVVPPRVKVVTVCMIGGGGNGHSGRTNVRGGTAGKVFSGNIAVTAGSTITVKVGASQHPSVFGSKSVAGGAGGAYSGNHQTVHNCKGTFRAGGIAYAASHTRKFYGGQAGFANGGNGIGSSGRAATKGSGAGGCSYGSGGAKGGTGVVHIKWG